jgi:integrase/recombinase XerD
MSSKDHKTERHIIDILSLMISLDKFYAPLSFTSISNKEQLLTFLDHRKQKDGKWVKREHDVEGRYITSFNFYLGLLRIFFRWLVNRDKSPEDWETPTFLKIKPKKSVRDSPYGINDIWELDDVLTIVSYEPELRNQAIITLLWDLDARPHEITALRIKDIILNEQYGEGTIPSNTKTGGGPILLTSSFTYVRDWINKHPFKNEPNARLICNLVNGAPVTTQVIWQVMNRLRLHIKRLTESGAITDEQQRRKLEYLLGVKKWNPYCLRHSAITDDSDHLPEFAVKKKARWVMDSQQGRRYIKNRMGDELKNKILEHHGIRIATKQQPMVSRPCGRCGYVNKLDNKFCEAKGCNYPLTQLALDEIKAAEQAKMQQLISESNLERDNTIQALRQEMRDMMESYKKSIELSTKQNNMIKEVMSKYDGLIDEYTDLKGLFDKSMSTTEDALGRIDELQNDMRGGLLIKLGRGAAEELQRRAKILLQVAPDWKERTASGNARLTPEEERKVTKLINQHTTEK